MSIFGTFGGDGAIIDIPLEETLLVLAVVVQILADNLLRRPVVLKALEIFVGLPCLQKQD